MSRPLVAAVLTLAACSTSESPRPTTPAATSNVAWTLEPVRPDTSHGLRILVFHDMEGLSGQSDPATFLFGTSAYPKGQELLAADINAVVAGLYDGGATEVMVADGHGSGNPAPDLRTDLLDRRAKQIVQGEDFDSYFDTPKVQKFDGVAVVGMHAKTGSRGFASHTYTFGIGIAINGQFITETELVGLSWGRYGTPVIFASGDDRLAADLATPMPWIEYVTVKKAIAADSAELRPVAEARAELTSKAKLAMENLKAGKEQAMKTPAPLRVGLRAVPPSDISALDGIPGITYADSTATVTVDSLRVGYSVLLKMVGIATSGYRSRMFEIFDNKPDPKVMMSAFLERVGKTWFDYESGRWKAPPARRAPTEKP
ncbi:MAG: M55 family metallopeptidase [Gemmatimonadaceae bacterium]